MAIAFKTTVAFNGWFNAAGGPTYTAAAGDYIYYYSQEYFGNQSLGVPAGWTDLTPVASFGMALFAYGPCVGGETIPQVNWGNGGFQIGALYVATGASLNVSASASRASAGVQNFAMPLGSFTPADDGCLILLLGGRNKASASDGSTLALTGGYSGVATLRQTSNANGGRPSAFLADIIQTTATAVAAGSVSTSISDGASQTERGLIIAIKPTIVPAGGTTNQGVGMRGCG